MRRSLQLPSPRANPQSSSISIIVIRHLLVCFYLPSPYWCLAVQLSHSTRSPYLLPLQTDLRELPPTFVIMSAGLLKPEKDFTKDADKLIPEAEALAKVRNLPIPVSLILTFP